MVSSFPRLFEAPDGPPSHSEDKSPDGLGVLDRIREAFCGLHGHDSLLQFEQDRMFLKCVSCGHESPGWELNEPRPTVVARADKRRLTLMRPQLVGARRIA